MYTSFMQVPYPKAGDLRKNINPVVKLYIAETGNVQASHRLITPPRPLRHR